MAIADFGGALAAVGGWAALAWLGYAGYARSLADDDGTAALARLRRAIRLGLPIVYVGALFTTGLAGWPDALDRWLAATPLGEGIVTGALVLFGSLALPLVAVVAGYLGAYPTVRRLRGVDASRRAVAAVLARYLLGILAITTILLVALSWLAGTLPPTMALVAGGALVVLVLYAGVPVWVRLVQETREPTDDERGRLLSSIGGLDAELAGIRVLETVDATTASAVVRGPPGWRHLLVTDGLLDRAPPAVLRTTVALTVEGARRYRLEARLAITTALVVGTLGPVWGLGPFAGATRWLVPAAVVPLGLLALWLGRRLVFRTDDAVAAIEGPDAVADAVEWYCEDHDAPREWSRRRQLARMEPSPASRIERLRERDRD